MCVHIFHSIFFLNANIESLFLWSTNQRTLASGPTTLTCPLNSAAPAGKGEAKKKKRKAENSLKAEFYELLCCLRKKAILIVSGNHVSSAQPFS